MQAAPWPHEADLDLAMFYEIVQTISSHVSVLQESILLNELLSRKVNDPGLLLETGK